MEHLERARPRSTWGLDLAGRAYLTGHTSGLSESPTPDALQPQYGGGSSDAFVGRVSADGSTLDYLTYLGGSANEEYAGSTWPSLVTDGLGTTYVVGTTRSTDFPTMNALQPNLSGSTDGFLVALTFAPRCQNRWNARWFACDAGHENSFVLQHDGTPVCGSENCPGPPTSCWGPLATERFHFGPEISWSTGAQGELQLTHAQDLQVYGDTFLLVSAAKSLSVPVTSDVGRVWLNGVDVTTPGSPGLLALSLVPGWNHLEWTSYNFPGGSGPSCAFNKRGTAVTCR